MTEGQQQEQEWFDIPGHPGYKINKAGDVLGKRGSKLKTAESNNKGKPGYLLVPISAGGKVTSAYVHRLVALTFVANDDPRTKTQVNHKNMDRQDNRIDNLEWVTHAENLEHAAKTAPPVCKRCGLGFSSYSELGCHTMNSHLRRSR